jgi:hypothetical protein
VLSIAGESLALVLLFFRLAFYLIGSLYSADVVIVSESDCVLLLSQILSHHHLHLCGYGIDIALDFPFPTLSATFLFDLIAP